MSSDDVNLDEQMDIVAQRSEFLELFDSEGQLETRDVVDSLEYSRSTVTRALRDLRDADLIERTADGYTITSTGVLLAEQYRRYYRASKATHDAKTLLQAIPKTEVPPAELLIEADFIHADSDIPVRALEAISDRVRAADTVHVYLPTLVDTHLLRVWHQAVMRDSLESQAIFDPDLLAVLKGQYPALLSEMASTDVFACWTGEGRPYGLVVREADETTTVSVIIYEDSTAVRGVITNATAAAVEWAQQELDRIRGTASEVTDELRELGVVAGPGTPDASGSASQHTTTTDPVTQSRALEAGDALPVALESEGFVRLSPTYFESHSTAPPEVSWRTGFTLSEVRTGHAVDRLDDNGEPVADQVLQRLKTGDDHVLLGPPGSGKSTICMSVACRWYEQDIGPVIYRGADGDAEVNSTSILRAYLRRTDGHALVVVEDAPREHASAIFEVIRTLDDDPTVSFLLDSRTSEWHETNAIGSDARLEQYRRSGIETVSVPRFTQQECSQFVETFATLLDEEPRISGSELFSMLQEGDGGHSADGDSLPVGTALIIQQYLARRQQASTGDPAQSQPTALEETVERVYRQLTAADHDTTLDLAIASAALNAAGLAVTAEYLYALAPAEQFDDIDAGLAELQGTMLFEHTNPQVGMSKTYRTYHETWSTRFLEQVLADRSTSDVQARFGEYVSRLLSLADEPERREMIERHVEGSTSHLHRIEADPEGWAMALIKRLFEFGQTAAKLAPLFGSADAETIELPDVCAESVTIQTSYWRGCIYRIHGDFEQAEQEFERLTDLVSNASIEGDLTDESMAPGIEARDIETLVDDTEQETEASIWRDEWHATAQIQLGGVARERGDLATATQRFENALHLYEELGDAHGEATAQKHLGVVALKRGEVNAGKEYLDRSLDTFQRLGDEHGEAETLSDLGICAQMRGDIETAMDRFERSLEIFRDIGDRRNEAKALGNLGTAANVQGDMAAAERYKQEALTVFREIGDRHGEASALGELALIAQKQGNLERAVSHTRESLRLFRAVGDRHGEGMSLNTLGEVRYEQGQDESAVECFETALEVFQQVGDTRSEAEVRVNLGQTARDRDDLAAALKQYERSAALFETVDDTQGRADLAHRIGDLRYRRGEPGLAQSWFETAAEGYLDSNDKRACDVIDRLVEIYGSNGQSEAAVDWCRQGEQFAGEAGLEEWQDEFRTRRQVLAETDA